MHTDKLAWALAWAARGFKVFPIAEGTKDEPMVPFTQEATTDPVQITRWWRDELTGIVRNHNIGMLTDGLSIVDIDTKEGRPGLQTFHDLGGHWNTLVVLTPSGGYHAYYLPPHEVANAQWRDTAAEIQGVDIRGYHGYVVAPGSVVDGRAYQIAQDMPLATLPAPILARCKAPGERSTANTALPATELDTAPALAAAQGLVAQTPGAPHGDRSGACYRLACQLRDRGVSEPVAKDLIVGQWIERCQPAMDRIEALETVGNAYHYAQNAAGAKAAAVDFAHVMGLIEPPPLMTSTAAIVVPDDAWAWGNVRPMHTLTPRPWVVDRILLRGEITALIAASGVGKSQLLLTVAILLALGRDVFGLHNALGRPAKSMIYNAEDSRAEMEKRFYATCIHMNVDPDIVRPYVALVSGKEIKIKLVNTENHNKPQLNVEMVKRIIDFCADPDCVFLGMDPLIALHDIDESLNTPMRYVLETIMLIAERANVAVGLAVHTGHRGNKDSYAGNADAGRGAMTIRDTCRVSLTLSPPTKDDVERNDISPTEYQRLLRLDDAKMNYGLTGSAAVWMRKHTIALFTGDKIAAFEQYDMQSAGEANREELGMKVAQELLNDATADVSLQQMVARLCATDPLYAQLSSETLKGRLERILAAGVDTPSGPVRTVQRHGRKCVAFE